MDGTVKMHPNTIGKQEKKRPPPNSPTEDLKDHKAATNERKKYPKTTPTTSPPQQITTPVKKDKKQETPSTSKNVTEDGHMEPTTDAWDDEWWTTHMDEIIELCKTYDKP